MIDLPAIKDIIATYEKHGWNLRRVLLSPVSKRKFVDSLADLVGGIPFADAEFDAAWFSRSPKTGAVAWEIRYLGELQFALLETLDESDPAFESYLHNIEERLKQSIAAKISGLTT